MSTIISAQMVNELRTATGAGLLDCKKALTEANGDVAAATTILRKKLGNKLDKLSSRATKEGLIESYIHVGGKVGVPEGMRRNELLIDPSRPNQQVSDAVEQGEIRLR